MPRLRAGSATERKSLVLLAEGRTAAVPVLYFPKVDIQLLEDEFVLDVIELR